MEMQPAVLDSDQQHLRLLSIFHYVAGGLLYLFGFFPIIHLLMGILMLSGVMDSENQPDEAMLRVMGCFFLIFPLLFMMAAWTLATLIIVSGRKLARRVSYTFCLVIAGIECVFMPFGTVLGIFTIIVLCRPSVKEIFVQKKSAA